MAATRNRQAAVGYVSIGDSEAYPSECPITVRRVRVALPESGLAEIGMIIDRSGYESGYPNTFEVFRMAAGAWGYYPSAEAAEAGAREYAAAYAASPAAAVGRRGTAPHRGTSATRCVRTATNRCRRHRRPTLEGS